MAPVPPPPPPAALSRGQSTPTAPVGSTKASSHAAEQAQGATLVCNYCKGPHSGWYGCGREMWAKRRAKRESSGSGGNSASASDNKATSQSGPDSDVASSALRKRHMDVPSTPPTTGTPALQPSQTLSVRNALQPPVSSGMHQNMWVSNGSYWTYQPYQPAVMYAIPVVPYFVPAVAYGVHQLDYNMVHSTVPVPGQASSNPQWHAQTFPSATVSQIPSSASPSAPRKKAKTADTEKVVTDVAKCSDEKKRGSTMGEHQEVSMQGRLVSDTSPKADKPKKNAAKILPEGDT